MRIQRSTRSSGRVLAQIRNASSRIIGAPMPMRLVFARELRDGHDRPSILVFSEGRKFIFLAATRSPRRGSKVKLARRCGAAEGASRGLETGVGKWDKFSKMRSEPVSSGTESSASESEFYERRE
ncbi:hypothetical protein KM043_000302 [Ampulex compressa]|nr:hypothetical protein KM043_000302 [Ampulex compressa]